MGKKSIKPILEGFKKCFYHAPLPVISLVIYMGLRSSVIFPDDLPIASDRQPLWQHAYLGWYDWLFLLSTVVSFALGTLKISKANFVFIWTLALTILLSFINALTLEPEIALDATVYLLRFALTFSLSVWLVRRLGSQAVESLIICLFVILAITALFVGSLQFRTFNRLYASAMTVASFSQVAVVVCFIALIKKYNTLLGVTLCFLSLTFSKTSILLLLILLSIHFRGYILGIIKYLVIVFLIFASGVFTLLQVANPIFTSFFSRYVDPDSLISVSGRLPLWGYATHLLQSGKIPLLGVGFNAAASLFVLDNINYVEKGEIYYNQHFHSILIEYGFGLGILSIFIFFFLFKRIWQTFHAQSHVSFLIFSFFLLCQSIDYSFYRPKEVIIWSLILGLAEGKWKFEGG